MIKLNKNLLKLSEFGFTILQIETKANCNMECRFCPYPIRDDKDSILDEQDVINLIDQINPEDKKFEYLCFSQFNEPLLDPKIFKFIKYANSKNVRNLLITNALLFNKESKRRDLINCEPAIIKISLQNLDVKKFNWARGSKIDVEDYFLRIYKFLSEIKEKKTIVSLDVACNFFKAIFKKNQKSFGYF
tara:strand:- start:217 stop:783 length:567 start_codon:yes stop_codon:yes gene_type:complete